MDRELAKNNIRTLNKLITQYEKEIEEAESDLDVLRYGLENAEDAKRKILDLLDAGQGACDPS